MENQNEKAKETQKKTDIDTKYWRSEEELNAFKTNNGVREQEPEFLTSPLREDEAGIEGTGKTDTSRREFVKLMAASTVMLGASACTRRPVEKIVPYVKKPEEIVPGVANWYASTCSECEANCGIVVKTREGRPIKVEGNENHPASQGGLCARGQASILNLYDADRLQKSVANSRMPNRHASATTQSVLEKTASTLNMLKSEKGRVVVLTGKNKSPSSLKLIDEFVKGFGNGSSHVQYEALNLSAVTEASSQSFGKAVVPRYRFDKADMIVTFGADFLGTWGSNVEYSKDFSKKRKLGAVGKGSTNMSKLVAIEPIMTLTGSNSDQRISIKGGDEVRTALMLAHELIVNQSKSKYAGNSQVTGMLNKYPNKNPELKKVASELWENKGKSLVLGAGYLLSGESAVALENVVNLLNSALENEGSTVDGTLAYSTDETSSENITKLIAEMKSGKVQALLMFGVNPAYTLPTNSGFADSLKSVKWVAQFSQFFDETSKHADVVVATNNAFENWSDSESQKGLFNIHQPTISPLYDTKSFEDSLLALGKATNLGGKFSNTASFHDYLKDSWKTIHASHGGGKSFNAFWEQLLRTGFVDTNASARKSESTASRTFNVNALNGVEKSAGSINGMSLVKYPKVSQFDGKNANNSWLQEMPDPVSKVTWDNYACIAVSTADKMGIKQGDMLKVSVGSDSVVLPAFIQPGTHPETVAIAVGYGRTSAGRVGDSVGVNAFHLNGQKVEIVKTGDTYKLATTQMHHSLENRPIVKEATLKEYKKDHHAGNPHGPELVTIWPEYKYPGYKWGMSIDLNSCTGCGSCIIGCQSENNIPVVGRDNVRASREMHWIRIDRYYSGEQDNPETVHQPMMCSQCENAPCETVCPVLATMHDHEGLNQQVYNRCVGTRYCANNCPYKVRRFNWFTFTDVPGSEKLAYNPDITVRTRGVMEKCTFCIQRIREAKDHAKDETRAVHDGEIKTACQQSCPTNAIVFGNTNDKKSMVTKAKTDPRSYVALEDLNVRPSISYLTKIRNKEEA